MIKRDPYEGKPPAEGQHGQDDTWASTVVDSQGGTLYWAAVLAAVLFMLLYQSLFCGKGLVAADGVLNHPPWVATVPPANPLLVDQSCIFVPQDQFVYQQIWRGKFPLWNPYLSCGVPNLGSIQGALLFPIQLLLSPLDPFQAGGPAAFLKLFLAGLFTMLYLRQLGTSPVAAFLSGLVFSLSGFMIVWLGHPHVNCAMWLPLLLYFVEKTCQAVAGQKANLSDRPVLRAGAGFAVAFGSMLLGGHPPTAIHITIGVVIYFLFRQLEYRWTRWFRQACLLVGSMTLGVLLAAAQILPYLDYYRLSSSSSASANQNRWAGHLTPNTLIHFLLPYVSGGPSTGFERLPQSLRLGELDNFNERTGYVGILPLFLVLCAAAYRRCRFTIFYLCVALISLLVIYGVWPLPTIIRSLPILSHINHTRLLLFFCFSAAVLAGLGWDTLLRMRSRRPLFWVAIVFWVAVALALLWFWLLIKPRFQHLDSSHRAFLLGQLLVLAGGVISVGLVLWPVRWGGTVALMVGLAWLAIDLLWFGLGYNPAIPRELYYPRTRAIEWLEKDQSIFRILGGDSVLIPNTAQIFGLSDVRGCDFVSVRRYEELITGTAGNFFFYGEAAVLPEPFRLLNVKYVLLPTSLRLDPNLFELVYADEINIYRHKACCDRALLVFDYQVDPDPASVLARVRSGGFDPQKTLLLEQEPKKTENGTSKIPATNADSRVRIVSYEPDEVRIEASLPRPGFLLLLDTYFPGWSATVNGRKTPIYRADYNFRAVSLPTGRSTICFSYQPWSLRVGAVLSAASLLAIGALWFWPRKE